MTWSTLIPNRKLAAIDRHVKALDSNWPVVAVDNDLPSPTIFVNPKFLEASVCVCVDCALVCCGMKCALSGIQIKR